MSVRLSPNGHGLRPPVGSLLAAKRAQPFRSEARKGVPVDSPSSSPIFPKTRTYFLKNTLQRRQVEPHAPASSSRAERAFSGCAARSASTTRPVISRKTLFFSSRRAGRYCASTSPFHVALRETPDSYAVIVAIRIFQFAIFMAVDKYLYLILVRILRCVFVGWC